MENSVDMFGFNDEVDEFNEESTNFQVKKSEFHVLLFFDLLKYKHINKGWRLQRQHTISSRLYT